MGPGLDVVYEQEKMIGTTYYNSSRWNHQRNIKTILSKESENCYGEPFEKRLVMINLGMALKTSVVSPRQKDWENVQ